MSKLGRAWLVTSLLVCVGAPARAVVIPGSVPRVANGNATIPSNGAILIEADDTMPTIHVVASDGVVATGTLARRGPLYNWNTRYWAWVPDRPLPPGPYGVTLETAFGDATTVMVTVGEPWMPSLPELAFDLEVSAPGTVLLSATCSGPNGSAGAPSFDAELAIFSITALATSTAPPAELGQRLFAMRPAANGPVTTATFRPLEVAMGARFSSNADDYCVELDSIDIKTGVVTTYEAQHCLSSAEVGEVGMLGFRYAGGDLQALRLPSCNAPPLWHEAQWCLVNRVACAASDARQSCSICPPAVGPLEPNDAGIDSGAEQPTGAPSAEPGSSAGCRAVGLGSRTAARPWGTLLVAWIALAACYRRAACRNRGR